MFFSCPCASPGRSLNNKQVFAPATWELQIDGLFSSKWLSFPARRKNLEI